MPSAGPYSEAAPGSLPRQALSDLILLRSFYSARDRALRGLFGAGLRRNQLRDEIVRLCLIEFGHDRIRRVSFYQSEFRNLASRSSIQDEIRTLAALRLLVTRPDPANRSAVLVAPTKGTVAFYSNSVALLADDVRQIFVSRQEAPE